MAPRCCSAVSSPDEFAECYASVLVYGPSASNALKEAVEALEQTQSLVSCFTAWCPRCRGNYFLTTDVDSFPVPSAHHTHKLALLGRLSSAGIYSTCPASV